MLEPMKNLRELRLSGNPNIRLNPEVFKQLCQKLKVLDVSNCNIDENTFDTICSNCHQLETLVLSNNPRINFAGQEPIRFRETLKDLKIDNCELDTDDMLMIAGFKSIERLDISNNWLKGYFDGMFGLANLKYTLTELKASEVGITSKNLYKITDCSKITVLDIGHNNLEKVGYTSPFINAYVLGSLSNQLTSLNVSRANLGTNQLREMLDSSSIEILDCSCNDFSGIYDDTFEIGRAKSALKDVNFSNCYIKSPKFLSDILNCPCLTKLDISRNRFEMPYNEFVFGSSANSLKWLDISGSEINVRLFVEMLGKFETIEYLDISGEFSTLLRSPDHTLIEFDPSKVVSTVGGLKKSLKTLKASSCKLEDDYNLLYSLTDCKNLEHLDISGNNLSQFPTNFQFGSSKETLKYLNMSNCGTISMSTLRAVTDPNALEVLNMNNNEYVATQGCFEPRFSKNSLRTISMRGSRDSFNPSILQAFSECNTLEALDLSGSYMDKFKFRSFDFGAARSSLRKINMDGCKIISEVLLKAVFNCEKLQELSLNRNSFFNLLSDDFKLGDSKHSLKVLKMNQCHLRGQDILSEITDCRNLKELYLSENNFSGISSNFSFGSSKRSLKVLKMDRCGMTNLFTAITSCKVLETLSIAGNSLSSYNFGTSRNTLKDLDISDNSFSGIEDFNQIFNCKRLEKLDISGTPLNQFEQEFNPEKFSESKLKELVVAGCGLTRPSSLEILTSFPKIEKIDISVNYFDSFPDCFSLGISKDTLIEIIAENCKFSDSNIIKALTDCKRLGVLILCGNRGLRMCNRITFGASTNSLKELDLGFCYVDLLIWINEIKKCTKIQKLKLSGNDISKARSKFNCDEFKNSISYLDINICGIKDTTILSILAKYHRLELLRIDCSDLRDLNPNFNFGNLTYTLKRFSLDSFKNVDSNYKQKILRLFKFLEW